MITLNYTGLEETTDAIYSLNLGMGKNITGLVKTITEDVAEEMIQEAPVWHSELQQSITAEVAQRGDTAIGTAIADSDHASPIELGTGKLGPSKKPYYPNPYNIHGWAVDKGFRSGQHLAAIIFYLGTRPNPFAKRAFATVATDKLGRRAKAFIDKLES